jgi:leucyl-tRNA synthetase
VATNGEQPPPYDHQRIETALQARWERERTFAAPIAGSEGAAQGAAAAGLQPQPLDRPRWIYIKASAPFTSGNIHMGHVRSYAIGDAYARYCRARGDNVLFAFGYDSFGLPAELGAIAAGVHPSEWVARCADRMTAQLKRLGFSFNWERSFISSQPNMYRWSQWLFLTLLEHDLIYRGSGTVDFCPSCNTTLASIQVEDGRCWRCHGPVILVERPQWFLRISAYVPENDQRMAELRLWEETALGSQREVLGRLEGVEVDLPSAQPERPALTAFTTHPDALAQAAFVAISPRHPELERWVADARVAAALEELRLGGFERSARDAQALALIDTGLFVSAPHGEGSLPVVISPLVDQRFGPTAVLGIPARDRTDAVIAERLGLTFALGADHEGFQAPSPAVATLAAAVRPAVRYRARDFSISRQRYWGTPIPIVYCERCGTVPLAASELPLELPGDLRPTGAENPLASDPRFYQTSCPRCQGPARRETDTLDCHFDALWLWVPACVPPESRELALEQIFALDELRAWLPSERLVAGSDSGNFMFDQRIVTKALRDIGQLDFLSAGEPFAGALMHEMVIREGRKMSKHLGNVVEPDELVAKVGADTLRLAVLYAARPQRSLNWSESDVRRCNRFLRTLWSFALEAFALPPEQMESALGEPPKLATDHLRRRLASWCATARTRILSATGELEMHKALRDLMRLEERIRLYRKRVIDKRGELRREDQEALLGALALLLELLEPFAPHIAVELRERGGQALGQARLEASTDAVIESA